MCLALQVTYFRSVFFRSICVVCFEIGFGHLFGNNCRAVGQMSRLAASVDGLQFRKICYSLDGNPGSPVENCRNSVGPRHHTANSRSGTSKIVVAIAWLGARNARKVVAFSILTKNCEMRSWL